MAEKKKYNSILVSGRKDETLTYSKYIKDEESGESVKESLDKKVNVTDKLETQQIKDRAITNEKMAAGSVGNTNLQDGSVSNEKLEDGSITNEKLAENSITKNKLKDKTIGVEKLDNELRQAIAAATGLPENLVETIQNVDDTLKDHQSQLNDKQSQIDDKQQQITANDEDISLLQNRSTQMEETIKSIAATGGASQATSVTYDNENSGLAAVNAQAAIDETITKLSNLSKRQQFENTCLVKLDVDDETFNSWTNVVGSLEEKHAGIPLKNGSYDNRDTSDVFSPMTYYFKDTSTSTSENRYTSFLIKADPIGLANSEYLNARVYGYSDELIWQGKLGAGIWQLSIPYGYGVDIYANKKEATPSVVYKTGLINFNHNLANNISSLNNKTEQLDSKQQFELTCLSQLYVTDADFDSYTPISDGNLTESMNGLLTLGGGYDKSEGNGTTFMPRCYKFKDTSAATPENRYTSFLVKADPSGLVGNYINARVWDREGVLFWEAKLSKGYWQISLPYGYEIEIYGNIANNGKDAPKYKTGTFNDSEKVTTAGGINPWAGKCIAFYGDSVTWIGQGTGTSMGHASSPYAADWGYNWQLYVAKYLGLKEFYSRGVASAMYEYQDWVQYAHTETGYSGDRPYPFVSFDEAEEKEGWTKTHGYLAAWDRIKAQFPASIKDTIDAIFITDSNSAVNHTSDDFETPTFIKGATKDADWAADSVYNVFGGDYDITTFAGAICSMIMKLQVWMPNTQIIIGSQISGRGDESITEDPKPVKGANFTKLDEARRGMYCAEKTKKIVGMMSIPYIPVFESMSVNPLNRNGKINDIVHPLCQAGAYRVGKTIAQYLMNFTPSEPPV